MAKNERGFGAVEVVLIVVLVALIGVGGWWVWQKNQDANKSASSNIPAPTTVNQETNTPQKNTLAMTSDVTAEVPTGWIVQKQPADCPEFIVRVECVSGADVAPKDGPKTIADEPFVARIQVYKAAGATSAKDWFVNTMGMGIANATDQTSTDKINGYDTYYFKQNDTSYTDINYVFLKGDVSVWVSARVSEKHFASNGSGKVDNQKDFTAYTDAITSFAKSVIIK